MLIPVIISPFIASTFDYKHTVGCRFNFSPIDGSTPLHMYGLFTYEFEISVPISQVIEISIKTTQLIIILCTTNSIDDDDKKY